MIKSGSLRANRRVVGFYGNFLAQRPREAFEAFVRRFVALCVSPRPVRGGFGGFVAGSQNYFAHALLTCS